MLEFEGRDELRGDRLLVATGRRPRTDGLGLETVGVEPTRQGIPVDERMRVTDGVWAIGDVTGVWPLTYMGKYQGRVAASNILGRERAANYDAVPRVVFTDPQAAAVGDPDGPLTATVPLSEVPRTATYTRAYADSPGFMTLVSDGERLTGAYALGPEAGEWLQQATVAIRARVPLEVMEDVIQPFPTFSEIFLHALTALRRDRPLPRDKGTVPLRSGGGIALHPASSGVPRKPRAEVEAGLFHVYARGNNKQTHLSRRSRSRDVPPNPARHGQALSLALAGLLPDGQPRPPPARDPRSEPRRRDGGGCMARTHNASTPGTAPPAIFSKGATGQFGSRRTSRSGRWPSYIAMNPVEAGLSLRRHPDDWPWSSHSMIVSDTARTGSTSRTSSTTSLPQAAKAAAGTPSSS